MTAIERVQRRIKEAPDNLRDLGVLIVGKYRGPGFAPLLYAARTYKNLGSKVYPDPDEELFIVGPAKDPFVYMAEEETSKLPLEVELGYLRGLQQLYEMSTQSGVLYVVAWNGYVGNSAGIEIAYAMALRKRIIFSEPPFDLKHTLPSEIIKLITINQEKYPKVAVEDIADRFAGALEEPIPQPQITPDQHIAIFRALRSLVRELKNGPFNMGDIKPTTVEYLLSLK